MVLRYLLTVVFLFASSLSQAFEEEKFARALGLELVTEGHPFTVFGVHTMYANENLSRQLLLMRDVPGELKELRILQAKGYLIAELPKSAGTYFSMALVGITEDEIRRNLTQTTVWHKLWDQLHPLPRAHALEDCSVIEGRPTARGLEQLQAFYGSTFVRGSFSCVHNLLRGVWASSGGRVNDLVEGISNLITDPRAFWDRRVQQVRNLERFIANFDTRFRSIASSIAILPTSAKVQMLCGFLGGLGTDAAIAILAGGAGLGQLLFRMEEYVRRLSLMERVFLALARTNRIADIPPDFYARFASSRYPIAVIETLNSLADRQLPQAIINTMRTMM